MVEEARLPPMGGTGSRTSRGKSRRLRYRGVARRREREGAHGIAGGLGERPLEGGAPRPVARARGALWLAALTVLPLLPFLGKAVSIDAPVFVAVANQIVESPADPFGFQMIWDSSSPNTHEFNRNPPLVS
jgi:hypothetical protein